MTARVLVAGIGNVFLGDDAFGVEVVRCLQARPVPQGVEVADFGIRGFDLAYALQDGYDLVIMVDAIARGDPPGTISLVEPDLDRTGPPTAVEGHTMNPMAVFQLVDTMGGNPGRVLILGCEPESIDERMGLSPSVEGAIPLAVDRIERLLAVKRIPVH